MIQVLPVPSTTDIFFDHLGSQRATDVGGLATELIRLTLDHLFQDGLDHGFVLAVKLGIDGNGEELRPDDGSASSAGRSKVKQQQRLAGCLAAYALYHTAQLPVGYGTSFSFFFLLPLLVFDW